MFGCVYELSKDTNDGIFADHWPCTGRHTWTFVFACQKLPSMLLHNFSLNWRVSLLQKIQTLCCCIKRICYHRMKLHHPLTSHKLAKLGRILQARKYSAIEVIGKDIYCMFQGNEIWRCAMGGHVTGWKNICSTSETRKGVRVVWLELFVCISVANNVWYWFVFVRGVSAVTEGTLFPQCPGQKMNSSAIA